ncbi:reverse transcriptase domain-containing protein [Tanacetum coccineum]
MRTRSQARNRNRQQQQITPVIVEGPEFPMADNCTMAQILQAPIEGYEDAIVVPLINANNFELKQTLINLVQSEAQTWLDKEPPRSILTWDDLVSKFINQFFPPSKTTYLRNEITTFYQKPNETFNEAWERFKGLLRQCPHHGFSELHQLDTFYNSLNTNDQDALDSAAGGNFLDKMPRDGLAIIESKSKVRYSRSRAIEPRVSTNAPLSTSTPSNSFEFQQLAASLEDKMDIRMSRLEKMISEKNVTTPATVKAVEEICVTCGSNHNFNNYPLTRSDFPVFHDNIHQFQQTAAVGNFVQRNPPNLANQMRPPGFNQPNVQNNQGNQSRYQGNNFNSNQNRGNNFNQNHQNNQGAVYQAPPYQPPMNQPPVYQAPTQQIQGVSKTDFENYVKANDAVLKNVQNQGTLPSQTVTNPREQINAITTRSGKTLEGPSTSLPITPVVSTPQKEPEQNPETLTEKVQKLSLENTAHVPPPKDEDSIFIEIPKPKAKKTVNIEIQDLNSPRPNSYQPKLPYPERMKVRENCNISQFREARKMPGKFLILVCFTRINRTSSLADSGNDKDVEIKSSSSFTLTSPEESELEAYLERDSIPPGIDLPLSPTFEVSSSNPTSPTLTGEKDHSWKMSMFFSLVQFVWKMMKRNSIRKKIICLLATYLHQTPKPLSRPQAAQEVEEIKMKDDKISSDVPINTIVMPIRITFDNPIDFNDHFSKPKDFKKELTVTFDSTKSSILPPSLLDFDSPFTAELSASITLNSLGNEDKIFKPGILALSCQYHDKNLLYIEENLIENIPPGLCTDKTNITRKPSKTGKHGHEKRKSTREAKDSKPKPEKVKKHKELLGFTLKTLTKLAQAVTSKDCQLGNPFVHILDPRAHIDSSMISRLNGDD